ncbi:MAG: SUMF1/EgtB/PvdO family nonheme iron enzyme [Verrucomicrobia bacterium]|nr:SUMF1/EgtB/PvdO family nonheme iron enzyme [Verrucomicrobiota bacterium]
MKIKNIFILGVLISTSSAVLASSAPIIKTQPKSQTVNEGSSVTFSVVAENGSKDFTIPISGNVNLDMIWIEPGTFIMGSPEDELGRWGCEAQHKVTLTKGYWLGKYAVTQAQYKAIMGSNPSNFKGDNNPVDNVTWYDAVSFCEKLTAQEKKAGRLPQGYEYTLPTEAQWEYACRAGTTTALNSGKDLSDRNECSEMDEVGWYGRNSGDTTHPVGQKKPNNWGLYDMHGNIYEWCLDYWEWDYPTSEVTDPTGPSTSDRRILRGGCWRYDAYDNRSACRNHHYPDQVYYSGLRVALSMVQGQSSTTTDTLTYQWYKDGKVISGATASSYTIKSVKTSDAGKYTVKVSNSAGSVTSSAATLTVNVPVTLSSITINGNSSVNVGSTATYTCTATYSNGTTKTVTPTWSISSGTSYASITAAGVLTGKAAGTATVKATYEGKTATKNVTVNAVVVKPSITTQPKSQTVNEGSSATFSVTASGTTPLSYQWYKGSSKISGATSASYKISSVKTSDEGSYKVTVSNSAGSVTSSVVTLTVNSTTPTNPNGTAVRSVKRSGKSATVTLKLEPDADVSVMFVEEHVPSGVSISVNDGGTYVASRNMIRWSFLDGNAREISYVLTVADSFDGKVSLSGEVTFDETTVTVTGTSEIDFAILTHPADMNDDFEISTKEISSYALAWTKAQSWSREPADIPVTYVSRAAIIWVNGGYYDYDPGKSEPSCWVCTNVKPASVELAADSVNVRTINVLEGKAYVSVEVIPAEGISVYFVEEQLPAGMNLNVTNISDGGKYVEGRGLIRWSFLDAEPRTLTYTLEPETGFSGIIPLNGEVTFDEETFVTEGDTEANFGGGADVPVITAAYFGGMLIEGTIGGTYVIEYSEDGVNWTQADEITLTASSMYWADLTSANSPKRLYRAKVK